MPALPVPAGTEVHLDYKGHEDQQVFFVYVWDEQECPKSIEDDRTFSNTAKLKKKQEFACANIKNGDQFLYFAAVKRKDLELPKRR